MKALIITALLVLANTAYAGHCRQLHVAVVDTGLDVSDTRFTDHLCKNVGKNFVENETLEDYNGHGSHVFGLVQKYAGDANYCISVYKYYQENAPGLLTANREVNALRQAVYDGADIVNISGGGANFVEDEYLVIKTNPEVTFVVAAGNEGKDLDVVDNKFYPASYFLPNIVVVENEDSDGVLFHNSNYSKKGVKEIGVNIVSTVPCTPSKTGRICDEARTGTSMSTAIYSGKLVDKLSKSCEYR